MEKIPKKILIKGLYAKAQLRINEILIKNKGNKKQAIFEMDRDSKLQHISDLIEKMEKIQ